ncbi:hypothetical protein RRG08_014450 [Elysia crispata]|uniref:Uncharacterized protein n=1 Tax=Elysia crispata TaxID=231223 RepID=A0AAE0YHB7_9GAST|nr:hypothetical protein RRG08_014450 [Elysia crispata]
MLQSHRPTEGSYETCYSHTGQQKGAMKHATVTQANRTEELNHHPPNCCRSEERYSNVSLLGYTSVTFSCFVSSNDTS